MFTKIAVAENKRIIVTRNDQFARLLLPGVYRVFAPPMMRVGTESHDLRQPLFQSRWAPFLLQRRPDLVAQHFVVAKTGCLDVALIFLNGELYDVILPQRTVLLWKASGTIRVELANIGEDDTPTYGFSDAELVKLTAELEQSEDDWVFETQEEG